MRALGMDGSRPLGCRAVARPNWNPGRLDRSHEYRRSWLEEAWCPARRLGLLTSGRVCRVPRDGF